MPRSPVSRLHQLTSLLHRTPSAGDGKLTITDGDGKELALTVGKKAKMTCDGKECKLEDLKKGTKVKVTTKKGDEKTALRIEAKTK